MSRPEDTTEITPVAELFVYHIFGLPPALKGWQSHPSTYSLEISGLVNTPASLSFSDILGKFPPVSAVTILQCMTMVHWGRVEVRGARLADVFEHVGIQSGAVKAALRGGEGFTTDLPVREIQADPSKFILAYEMNSEPLTADHGFPVRLVADGKYGYKWCKWLTGIELVDFDFKGHYEGKRGWSDAARRGEPVY
jgi:DMSO/TMAO reductase YedYZ molybdopterin-dependent catalytic subunit